MQDNYNPLAKNGIINSKLLNACIHCGLCLPACPTYLATGRELESPRGRIYLLNLWQQGKEPFSQRMSQHLDSCLGCFGCQTACPSSVNYESIFNQAKLQVNDSTPLWQKLPRYLVLRWILPNDSILLLIGNFLRLWQKLNFDKLLYFILSPLNFISAIKELLRWQALLPIIPQHKSLDTTGITSINAETVSLFKGCIMDIFYNDVNRQSIELLKLASNMVAVPKQTCCGALALHSGEQKLAIYLAKRNIEYFAESRGSIVVTASGCAAMLKTYPELFADYDPWHKKAKSFSSRIQDLPQFLAQIQSLAVNNKSYINDLSKPISIGYHAACHLAHAQGIRLEPKLLLENFANSINSLTGCQTIKLIPLLEEELCCGSAGIYNLAHPVLSEKILTRKIEMIRNSGVNIIVTTNPGCMLQLKAGIDSENLDIQVLHLATLLSKAYLNSFCL